MDEKYFEIIENTVSQWFSLVEQARSKYGVTKTELWAAIVVCPSPDGDIRFSPELGYSSPVTAYPQTTGIVNKENYFQCLATLSQIGAEIFGERHEEKVPEDISVEELSQKLLDAGLNAQFHHHDIIVAE